MLTKTRHKTGPMKIRLWHRNEYSTWRKSGAAAAAFVGTLTVVATNTSTGTTTTSAAGDDDHTKLNNFKKTYKSEKDYKILRVKNTFKVGKRNLREKHSRYKQPLVSPYPDTKTHWLILANKSHNLELFEEQVNFLCIVFEYALRTVKCKDLVRLYIVPRGPHKTVEETIIPPERK